DEFTGGNDVGRTMRARGAPGLGFYRQSRLPDAVTEPEMLAARGVRVLTRPFARDASQGLEAAGRCLRDQLTHPGFKLPQCLSRRCRQDDDAVDVRAAQPSIPGLRRCTAGIAELRGASSHPLAKNLGEALYDGRAHRKLLESAARK